MLTQGTAHWDRKEMGLRRDHIELVLSAWKEITVIQRPMSSMCIMCSPTVLQRDCWGLGT